MIVARTIAECRAARAKLAGTVGFVPTMGALHAGHVSLMTVAAKRAANVAVSIFVNPTQFGPNEDFHKYPRPIEADLEMCRQAGVALVFTPGVEEMYRPGEPNVLIDVPSLTGVLDGAHRPGHFAGVCQVVAKLFNIVQPDAACFGEKDFQQLSIIRAMTRGLDMPIEIVPCPTLREADGLAMSSRNRYLSPQERERALSISRALRSAQADVQAGERDTAHLRSGMHKILADAGANAVVPVSLDYATIVDSATLQDVAHVNESSRALIAMRVGTTRLIDNASLTN